MKESLNGSSGSSWKTSTTETRGGIRRRSVYVATVVAMLAMAGGFVLATGFTAFTVSNTGGANVGQSANTGTTIYNAATVTSVISQPASVAPTCTAGPTYTQAAGTASYTYSISVTGLACVTSGADVYDTLTFTSATLSGTFQDTFTVTAGSTTVTLYFTTATLSTSTQTLILEVDLGSATTLSTAGLPAVSVVVVGA